jgi:peptidoglycan/xylan/chitin deacetylase (PgdA/CDA1 family)
VSTRPQLTVCAVTGAPAARLEPWLTHVRAFADEVVLSVDAAAGPEALELARRHADDVAAVEIGGLPNRAYGWTAERASGDWILALDDDEMASDALVRALPALLAAEDVTHYHLPVRWIVPDADGGLAWIREFPWYPNHATRLFRNRAGSFRHPPRLHGIWEVAGEGRALPAAGDEAILHLNLALSGRRERERKMERRYRALAGTGVPTCEEYYLYEDYGPGLDLVPLDGAAAAAARPLLGGGEARRRLGRPSRSAPAVVPAAAAAELPPGVGAPAGELPIWSAAYVSHDTPAELGANRGHLVTLRLRNTSGATWSSRGDVVGRVVVSYRWRAPDGDFAIPQGDVTLLPRALAPGEEAEVVAGLWTPAEPGSYRLEWEALCERVAWFSDRGVPPLAHDVEVVDRGPRPRAPHFVPPPAPAVALTFDDGPDPDWTPRLLDELDRLGVRATFFVLGERAAGQRRLLRRMRRAGHEIGLHGNSHLRHDEHSREQIEADARAGLAAIGRRNRVRLWRPPHGIATQASVEVARELGVELAHWTADTQDWQAGQTVESMLALVEPLLAPGAVVLMHDAVGPGSPRATPESTIALVEPLVAAIRARGLDTALVERPPPVPVVATA